MKLLSDENFSRKLTQRLAELFPGCRPAADVGLMRTADAEIREFAKAEESTIVTVDSDFFELATSEGPPPKVIWLRRWVHPTRDAEALLRREAIRISEFGQDPELGVLVLDLL